MFITQLIYIRPGQENIFHQFEDVAIPIIAKYNGKLLLRLRPKPDEIIESNIESPYELHLVEFDNTDDFQDFMKDEERKQFLYLKEQSIKAAILIKGEKL
jgi:antibiotic biosynthesis monooxygenase (ABM) superfamily enzyme